MGWGAGDGGEGGGGERRGLQRRRCQQSSLGRPQLSLGRLQGGQGDGGQADRRATNPVMVHNEHKFNTNNTLFSGTARSNRIVDPPPQVWEGFGLNVMI